ncbi:MAG: hypothetical protein JRN15_17455 [Nitrososphaerota archaeon]|nr:hypothetical protein [Nitrososphaerota archaeon]
MKVRIESIHQSSSFMPFRKNAAKYRDELLCVLVIVAVTLLIYRKILLNPGLIYWGDFTFPFTSNTYLETLYPAWNSLWSYSTVLMIGRLPFVFIPYLIGLLTGSAVLFERIIFLLPFVISWGSMYLFLKYLKEEAGFSSNTLSTKILLLSFAATYSFNYWTLNRIDDYFSLVGYSLLPFATMKLLQISRGRGSLKNYFLFGLTVMFMISGIDYVVIFGIIFVICLAINLLLERNVTTKNLRHIVIAVAVVVALSAFWWIPYLASTLIGQGFFLPLRTATYDEIIQQNLYSTFLNTVRLRGFENPHFDFNSIYYTPLESVAANSLAYLLPITATLGILLNRTKNGILLSVLLFVFLFLGVGPNSPSNLQTYYDIVFKTGSLGLPFRAGNVWTGALAFTMVPLSMLAILRISSFKRSNSLNLRLLTVMIAILLVSSALQTYPQVAGHVDYYYNPTKVPSSYFSINSLLGSYNNSYKSLWIPEHYEGLPTSWNPKPTGPLELYSSEKPSFNMYQDYTVRNFYYFMLNDLLINNGTNNFGRILQPFNIGYVIHMNDTLQPSQSAIDEALGNQNNFTKLLSNQEMSLYAYNPTDNAVWASNDPIVYVGSLQNFASLLNIPGVILPSDLTLVAQDRSITPVLTSTNLNYQIILGSTSRSLAGDLSYLMSNYTTTISPFDYSPWLTPSHWSKTSTSWPQWPSLLGALQNIRETDFNKGLVYTTVRGSSITMPLIVNVSANYEIGIRYLTGNNLGNFSIQIDGNKKLNVSSSASSTIASFEWSDFPNIYLSAGRHEITLTSLTPNDFVNIITFTKQSEESNINAEFASLLNSNNIGYVSQAKYAVSAIDNSSLVYDPELSGGSGITFPNASMTGGGKFLPDFSIDVLSNGEYNLWVSGADLSSVKLITNGSTISPSNVIASNAEQWAEFANVALSTGKNSLRFYATASSIFDNFFIAKQGFSLENTAVVHGISNPNPYTYLLNVSSPSPFVTSIPELYDPHWVASYGSSHTTSLRSFDVLNGFIIYANGTSNIRFTYVIQSYAEAGLLISTLTFLGLTAALVFNAIIPVETKERILLRAKHVVFR